jgi:hypothetical protein
MRLGDEFVTINLDPGRNEFTFRGRKRAAQHYAGRYVNDGFVILMLDVDGRFLVPASSKNIITTKP